MGEIWFCCTATNEGGRDCLTEANAWVLGPDVVTLFVGEEHVGGETTLGCVGVWTLVSEVVLASS